MRYGTVVTLFHGYSHDIIMNAINSRQGVGRAPTRASTSRFLFAGGLFGVLAAVNEAVEDSYWLTLGLVLAGVAFFLYLTYGTLVGTLILMIPVVLSQLACEAFMYLWQHRPERELAARRRRGRRRRRRLRHLPLQPHDRRRSTRAASLDDAVDYATATTGKAIIFTASDDGRRARSSGGSRT